MKDTSKEILDKWHKDLMSLEPSDRLEMACSQYEFAKEIVKESILQKTPGISKKDLDKQIFLRFYEKDFEASQLERIFKHFGWS